MRRRALISSALQQGLATAFFTIRLGRREEGAETKKNSISGCKIGHTLPRAADNPELLLSRFSATTPLTPPGPSSLAMVAKRWTRSSTVFLMPAKGRAGLPSSAGLWYLLILRENH